MRSEMHRDLLCTFLPPTAFNLIESVMIFSAVTLKISHFYICFLRNFIDLIKLFWPPTTCLLKTGFLWDWSQCCHLNRQLILSTRIPCYLEIILSYLFKNHFTLFSFSSLIYMVSRNKGIFYYSTLYTENVIAIAFCP